MKDQNHGPEDPQGPQGPRSDGSGAPDGSLDEEALRALLRGAVSDLEPDPEALEHIRRAVPARRSRRRQALVGAAAAVLLGGTAVPALYHAATTGGVADDRSTNTASSQRAQQSAPEQHTGGGSGVGGGAGRESMSGGKHKDSGAPGHEKSENRTDGPSGTTSSPDPDNTSTMAATSPSCDRDQLGQGTAKVGQPDKDGRIYGSFRVVNTSDEACTVEGGGTVSATAQGTTQSSRISVVDHTTGDAATGLPDPATAPREVILKPGQAYSVQFAWIPAAGGAGGCSTGGGGTPSPGDSGGGSPSPGTSTSAGTSSKAADTAATEVLGIGGSKPTGEDPGTPQPTGSVQLTHVPEVGEPAAASATIPGACAGTIYRTGALGADS
ncbi:hypothetical protein [Streptomyces varsoviensis]|uniref:hypothetical protein n=1 Tax=Streptomyces varsoviensis TaxID=67373 RepID=UPI000ACF2989|nr:hypothetical protein [Streptomyces varsoviensis]